MATKKFVGTSENEVIEIRNSSPFNSFNGRGGDDIYVISPKLTKNITIADNSGNNIINLPNGISIKSTVFYADQVDYTLSTGAVVSVLGGANVGNIKFVWGDLDLEADLSTPEGQAALTADAKTMSFTETAAAFGVDVTKLSNDTPQETTKPVQVTVSVVTDPVTGEKTVAAGVVEEVDVKAPVYQSSVVSEDGKTVTLTYDDASLAAISAPAAAFSVTVDGNKVTPAAAAVNGATVVLTLTDAITTGQPVTVSYTAPAAETTVTATDAAIQDLKGNNSVSFSNVKVTTQGSTVAPDLTAPEFILADAQVSATGTSITLPYNESLGASKPASSAFKITVDGKTASPASVTIDGDTVVLSVNKPIITGAAVSIEYIAPAVTSAGKTNPAVQDLAGNDATGIAAGTAVTNGSLVDGTAPKVLSTSVSEDGKSIVLVYDEILGAKTAGVADFEVKVDGVVVRAATFTSSEDTITLTLPRTVTSAEKVTVSYTAPAADPAATNTATQDAVGNDSVSLIAVEATNNSQVEPAKVLTTAVEAVTGTDNDDVFTGVVSTASTTLNATDTIDGGAGDNTLNLTLDGNFDGFTGTGSLKNVQTVNLNTTTSSSADGFKFNATGAKGITKYIMDGAKNSSLNVEGASSLAEANLYSLASGKLGLSYDATSATSPALAAGTNATDNQKVTVTNVGTTSAIDVAINGVETLTLTSAGTSNKVALANVTAAKTITIAGDATTTVTSVDAVLTSFDAAAAKGAVTADLTGAAATLAKVAGGQGDDSITVDLAKLTSSAAISGGTGNDTVVVNSATKTDSTSTAWALSGVETLKLATLKGDLVVSNSAFGDSNLKSLVIGADLGGSVSLTSSSADFAVTSTDALTAITRTVTLDNSNAATIKYSASSTTATTQTNALNYTLINAKDVAVTVDKYISATGTIKAYNATNFAVTATDGALTAATIELPTATGKGTVTTGTNASSLTIKATQLTELAVNAGGTLTLTEDSTAKLSGVKTLTVNTEGAFTAGAIGVAQTVTLAGTSGGVTLGALGSSAATLGVSLTAAGLSKGLTTGAINGGSGAVTANISGTTGAVTLGTVDSKAKVTVDATKALGAVTVGAVTGQDVVVSATNAITSFAIGKITADKTVEYKAPSILANGTSSAPISIEGGAASTDALAVTITGGNLNDAFKVTGGAKQTSLTVTATGLAGTDTLTIAPATSTTAATKIDASAVSGFASTITDGSGNDTLLAGSGADSITGASGNDSISGGAGIDTITGGVGSNTISGGAGNDAITVNTSGATDTITDLAVGDTLTITAGTANVLVAAGTTDFSAFTITNSGTLSLNAAAATAAVTVTGTTGAESITGSTAADNINGGSGADSISGGLGNDTLTGGAGNDTFTMTAASTGTTTITDWGTGTDVMASTAFTSTGKLAITISDSSATALDLSTVLGASGVATVTGGTAADTITGGSGADSITGGAGNDSLTGGAGNDTFVVTDTTGTDTIADYGLGTDVISGAYTGAGTLKVVFNSAAAATSLNLATVLGASAMASVTGGTGNDTITGGSGIDSITGGTGNDSITGGTGNDIITVDVGTDTIADFGLGTDVLSVTGTATANATMYLNSGVLAYTAPAGTITASGTTATFTTGAATSGTLNLSAATNAGTLTINAASATGGLAITGTAVGSDSIAGGAGNDTITGGSGNDSITGGAGNDSITVAGGTDSISDFGYGTDVLSVTGTATANATMYATSGAVSYTAPAGTIAVSGATATFTTGAVTSGTLDFAAATNAGTLTINASAATGGLTIKGTAVGSDTITGGSGNDTITGGSGADSITGGTGNDTINLVAGTSDSIDGGTGTDTLALSGSTTVAATDLNNVSNIEVITVANTTTNVTITTVDALVASGATLTLAATSLTTGRLIFNGSAETNGTFNITGGGDTDTITGGTGADTLSGGSGADTITGGKGADSLTGGAAADTFAFIAADTGAAAGGSTAAELAAAPDVITDWNTGGSDVIDFTAGALVQVTAATAAVSGTAQLVAPSSSVQAVAVFHANDNTLALKITAVEAAINASGTAAARQAAAFVSGSDSYVFVSDGVDGVDANDVLIKLTGVTVSNVTLTAGGDFTIA